MERLEKKNEGVNVTYAPVIKEKKDSGAIVDWFMTALVVIIAVALIATYFVDFDVETEFNLKKATTTTLWFAVGTFCLGELAKLIFRRKCEKTEEYQSAEREADTAIKTLNESGYADRAAEYCQDYTEKVVQKFRQHQLLTVGISEEDFEEHYLGKGFFSLLKLVRSGKMSFLQMRAILRCNNIKTKPYDSRFITSYNAEGAYEQVPSEQHDTKKANRINAIKSVIFTIGSAVGIGFVFRDVILDFSAAVIFIAIIKLITMGINFGLKASFGWNLGLMEIKRNKLRASESRACMEWAKRAPVKTPAEG